MTPKITDQTPETGATRTGSGASLGAQLRRAREAQGMSLRQVSEQTRIQMRYLEAIEADNFQQLPGGIFNRSFIKAYARQVGLDEDEILEVYARTAREQGTPSDEEMPTSYQPRVYTNGDSTRSPWINLLLGALIVGVLSIGAYALQHWYNRTSEQNAVAPAAANTPAAAITTAPVAPEPSPLAAQGLNVAVRAVGEEVSLRAEADGARRPDILLRPSDAPIEFTPQNRLSLRYARARANSLEVTINGRRARVPADATEMVITPDNYQQLLQ